ncbi:MAG: hypothetical protein AB8B91_19990 [Rubripirellula sp.]
MRTFLLSWVFAFLGHASLLADIPYQIGEEIEVNTSKTKWLPGKIADTNRTSALCEYKLDSREKRGWFTLDRVRRAYEKDGLCRGRSWSDQEEKFSVIAVPLHIGNEEVVFRTEDHKQIRVKIAKLSTIDQSFLQKLSAGGGDFSVDGSFAGGKTVVTTHIQEPVEFDASSTRDIELSAIANVPLEADPLRSSLTLDEGGSAFEVGNAFDKVGAIIPLGGPDQWLLASLESGRVSPTSALPTRLMWVSIKKSKMMRMHPLTTGVQLKDYNTAGKLALTVDPFASKPILSLWKSEPAGKQCSLLLSWYASANKNHRHDGNWARFVGDRLVIFRDSSRNLIAWDYRDRKSVWTTVQQSAQAPTPQLTPGRRYLLIPESKRIRVIDPVEGREVSTIPVDEEIRSLSIAEDGRRVAMLLDSSLVEIDLTRPGSSKRVDVGSLALPKTTTVQWLENDVICLSTTNKEMLLYSIDRGIPLWRYEFDDSASYRSFGDDRVRRTMNGHLVYAASVTATKNRRVQRGIGVGAVRLPGKSASGYVKYLKRDELIVFDKGDKVRLVVESDHEQGAIHQSMLDQIAKNEWVIDDASSNVVLAKIHRGPSQTVHYRFGAGAFPGLTPPSGSFPGQTRPPSSRPGPPSSRFGPPSSRLRPPSFSGWPFGSSSSAPVKTESATVRPFISSILIAINGQPQWAAVSISGVPPSILLAKGETVQQKVDEMQKPNIDFFTIRDVPESFVNPEFREGLGTSLITNRGLKKTD